MPTELDSDVVNRQHHPTDPADASRNSQRPIATVERVTPEEEEKEEDTEGEEASA